MSCNLRYSTHKVASKTSIGGAPIQGSNGIFSPSNISLHNVFDELTKEDNLTNTIDYRCLYFQNDHTDQTISNPCISFGVMPVSADFQVGLINQKGVVAEAIENETTLPSGIHFITPETDKDVKLLPEESNKLAPGEFVGFWLKRVPKETGTSGTRTSSLTLNTAYDR